MRCLLLLAALALPVSAQLTQIPAEELPPLPTYHIKRAVKPPLIDGQLSPGEWDRAETVDLEFWWPKQTGPRERTTVRLLWDDVALYVGYDCVDTDLTAIYTQRDDPTYKDDVCEIFLMADPRRKPTSYIGLEMNARAVMYDYAYAIGAALFRRYDLSGWLLATRLDGTLNMRGDTDRGFQLEVAVPFRNFDDLTSPLPPPPGTTWRAQICRWNGTEPHRALSLWTHSGRTAADPHNPERFGTLVFDGEEPK
ncbi:MAG: carbohydrate-binding family 9-like protein [Armatimonadetes bacterium]|nr:carbohydrate-binding family 9-like protein [Armatimonadota bacterium]